MSQREVVIGVTGGVAAYKTATLVSRLAQADIQVTTVMTDAAQQFVGAATFASLSGRPVATHLFDSSYPLGAHIEIARRADLFCVAPATADFLAKSANGLADDLLSTLYLAFTGPVLMAPAMNAEMWAQPAVQRNVHQLIEDDVQMIGPEEGWLSCRDQGAGRMSEPETILSTIIDKLNSL
ncbi:MAG: phosphopantothenoylcysteine decarboxylase [Blastopirellula sp.]|nr:MAG: phosphopantothenoylcysteine decarboxylase [Blastopirellula sp.]